MGVRKTDVFQFGVRTILHIKLNNDSSTHYSNTHCRTNATEIPFQGASSLGKEASSLPGGEGIVSSSYQRSLHFLVT